MSNRRKYRRLFRLPLRSSADREVDDEFRFHLEMRAAELMRAGRSPEAARDEASRQFGDINDARRFCHAEDRKRMRNSRRTQWLDNLRQDVVVAWRTMRRQPAFTATTVLVLAVAIGIATAAYGVVHAYIIRPLPYPDPHRLVEVIGGPSRQQFPNAPSLENVDWTVADRVFDATVAWDLDGFTLVDDERPEFVDGAWVSPGYFTALGFRPALGRTFNRQEYVSGAQVAIISHALWVRRFNRNPSIIGRTIRAHSIDRPRADELVTVVGVMGADSWHVSRFTDLLRPLSTPRFPSVAKLPPGMSIKDAQHRLNALVLPQLGAVDSAWHLSIVSLQDEYTYEVRPALMALFGASAFLLLIGGASVAGAQVARAASRRAEFQVRIALGASRARVVAQLLTESAMVASLAALFGVAIASVLLAAGGSLVGEQLRAGVPGGAERLRLDGVMLAMAIAAATLIGIGFGMLPALLSGRVDPSTALRGAGKGSASGASSAILRRTLIGAQIALTMMLLVGAGLMVRTVVAIGAEPLGFDIEQIVKGTVLLPLGRYPNAQARRAGVDRVLAGLEATPGVISAAVASPYPFRGWIPTSAIIAEGSAHIGEGGPRAVQYVVSPRYFNVMGIPIIAGRPFGTSDDVSSTAVAMISEPLARRLWPTIDPIGQRFRIGTDTVWRTVIGVTRETREVVAADQQPDVYLPYAQVPRAFASVLLRVAGAPGDMRPVLPRAVARVDNVLAVSDVELMTDVVARDRRRHHALTGVLLVFAGLALGLALLGLYSSLAYVVTQRRREIAIRVAMGSSAQHVAWLVLEEGLPVVAGGLVAGAALSVLLTKVLSTQLYGVTPTDLTTFVVIAIGLSLAALGAIALPIRYAMHVEPATALRVE